MTDEIELQAQELAKLLDVTPASLSGAAKKDHLCKGYPVAEWANRTGRGRVTGYTIPDEIYSELSSSANLGKGYPERWLETYPKKWLDMWDERFKTLRNTDDENEAMSVIEDMELTNRMMDVEDDLPEFWREFLSLKNKKLKELG